MTDFTVGRIEQLTRSHKNARPKDNNPVWVHTHRDLGIALKEIERLNRHNKKLEAVRICAEVIRDNKDADGIHIPIIGMSALEVALAGLKTTEQGENDG